MLAASWMSFSVMPPTPRCTNASFTSSRSSLRRLSVSASSEPVTSALSTRLSVAASPAWICSKMSSSLAPVCDTGVAALARRARCQCSRASATVLGRLLVGRDDELVAGVGHVGQAEHLHRRRRAGLLDLLALVVDARPARGPTPRRPPAGRRPSACPSRRGSWRPGHDRRRGWPRARRPWPDRRVGAELLDVGDHAELFEQVVDAEVLQRRHLDHDRVAAPLLGHEPVLGQLLHDPVAGRPCSRSILLMATTIGTSAALAWLSASIVWGITPSSAATTSTTMSVASAPRARMAVNASWPGVSMKVIWRPSFSTW